MLAVGPFGLSGHILQLSSPAPLPLCRVELTITCQEATADAGDAAGISAGPGKPLFISRTGASSRSVAGSSPPPAPAPLPAVTFGSTQATAARTKIPSDAEKSHDPKPQWLLNHRPVTPPTPAEGEPGSRSVARAGGGGGSWPSAALGLDGI